MPGMGHSKAWWDQYEALRAKGMSKQSAARITNSDQGRATKAYKKLAKNKRR